MRRMVVLFGGERPGNRAFSPRRTASEKRFADLMADRAECELEVAILWRTHAWVMEVSLAGDVRNSMIRLFT